MTPAILLVDDEPSFLNSMQRKLRLEGFDDITALADPRAAVNLIAQKAFDAAFLDITMPGMNGITLLGHIKELSPLTECIMVTANEDIPSVVKAVKLGAYDYLVKPIQPDQLVHALNRALEHRRLLDVMLIRQTKRPGGALDNPAAFESVITHDTAMQHLLREAELHARSDIAVLITGETGVGKELLAQAIHLASPRAAKPFVAINMLSISPLLFESEFFGHQKGAFTGATQRKAGYLAQANNGTLFLDEIGDLPLEIQGKLLRILQEKEFMEVGGTRLISATVRFVAATNRNLEQSMQAGNFRRDLFYRLQFACLHLPPLKSRRQDIPLLAQRFVAGSSRPGARLAPQAQQRMNEHAWPGNVRELKGVVEAAANLAETGIIEPHHLNLPRVASRPVSSAIFAATAIEPLAEVERRHIIAVYEHLGKNKTHAAKVLGIGMATLQRKLKGYRIA